MSKVTPVSVTTTFDADAPLMPRPRMMIEPIHAPALSCARSTTSCSSLPGIWIEPSHRPSAILAAPNASVGKHKNNHTIARRISSLHYPNCRMVREGGEDSTPRRRDAPRGDEIHFRTILRVEGVALGLLSGACLDAEGIARERQI